ncbi:MAG: SGNH/GDSL hydrolase family protein, partial [Myxococcales bacterium]|nr:SGNH/GDSL hydrolase family protein [Myxococcales bacterium]
MFEDTKPNAVVFGDSNTVSLGPAWAAALVRQGWPSSQVIVHHRAGTTPRHWLPKTHALHEGRFGVLWAEGRPALRDALCPATRLVIIGLGGNMMPGTRDERSVEALLDLVVRLAPSARLLWRGPPPSTASHDGVVASRSVRASRYRRNGMLKQLLAPLHFEVDDPKAERVYLDVLALHACGPTRGRPLGTGRDEDLEDERALVASLAGDRLARGEQLCGGSAGLEAPRQRGDLRAVAVAQPRGQRDLEARGQGQLRIGAELERVGLRPPAVGRDRAPAGAVVVGLGGRERMELQRDLAALPLRPPHVHHRLVEAHANGPVGKGPLGLVVTHLQRGQRAQLRGATIGESRRIERRRHHLRLGRRRGRSGAAGQQERRRPDPSAPGGAPRHARVGHQGSVMVPGKSKATW